MTIQQEVQMPSEQILAEYKDLEGRLENAFQGIQALRGNLDPDVKITQMSRLMTLAYANLLPKIEKLREEHPALKARDIPKRIKSPGELDIEDSFHRIEQRVTRVLAEKLPVRLAFNDNNGQSGPEDDRWIVEDSAFPHYIIKGFPTREEAESYAKNHSLPLDRGPRDA